MTTGVEHLEKRVDNLEKNFNLLHEINIKLSRVDGRLESLLLLERKVEENSLYIAQSKGATIAGKFVFGLLCSSAAVGLFKLLSKIPL